MEEERRYVTLAEWAEQFRIPLGSAYHLSAQRRIPGQFKIGNSVRIDLGEFLAAAKNGQAKPEAA
jgi:hypothetical protein